MIDKNEAPEGFEAKPSIDGCLFCYFKKDFKCQKWFGDCMQSFRKDGHDVIFVKKGDKNESL